jgi:hypothetical protein
MNNTLDQSKNKIRAFFNQPSSIDSFEVSQVNITGSKQLDVRDTYIGLQHTDSENEAYLKLQTRALIKMPLTINLHTFTVSNIPFEYETEPAYGTNLIGYR